MTFTCFRHVLFVWLIVVECKSFIWVFYLWLNELRRESIFTWSWKAFKLTREFSNFFPSCSLQMQKFINYGIFILMIFKLQFNWVLSFLYFFFCLFKQFNSINRRIESQSNNRIFESFFELSIAFLLHNWDPVFYSVFRMKFCHWKNFL